MAADLAQRIRSLLDERVAAGAEVGVQVAVLHDGEVVVDATAGLANSAEGTPVTPETLFFAGSTAKGIAAAVTHLLVARDELSYDLRAGDVWPDFGSDGRAEITVRQILLHTAGLPAPPYESTLADLADPDGRAALLIKSEPWWEPGTRYGYHALTFGLLLGEVVRRATGRSLHDQLRDLITGPLGIEDDVHFGLPAGLLPRVAHQEPARSRPLPQPEPGSPADRANPPGVRPDADRANRPELLTADAGSFGTMTALGAARVYAGLVGHLALPTPHPRPADLAEVMITGHDEVMGFPSSFAFGFSNYRPGLGAERPGSALGMIGMNGSAAFADLDTKITFALMRNHFDGDLATVIAVDRLVAEAFPS